MPIVESRVRNGTLTFDGTKDWSCQVLDVRLTPTNDESDQVETLCGDLTTPAITTTWTINGTIVSDFAAESATSVVRWALSNAGDTVAFLFEPTDAAGQDTIGGTCTIVPLELGGPINARIEISFEFKVVDGPTYTPVT